MRNDPSFSNALLSWYDAMKRPLPWRDSCDPYRIWLSEIMLQQTQVETVLPYYRQFLTRWPTVKALARADTDEVLKAWEGLGYYRRAHNLHATARIIAADHDGHFPAKPAALKNLPGIGEYTAGALASIAFGKVVPAVDGNVERVFSRLVLCPNPSQTAAARKALQTQILKRIDPDRPGDFNQALMELGAKICLPLQPRCWQCPVRDFCQAQKQNVVDLYPVRRKRKALKQAWLTVIIQECQGLYQVHRNPNEGLLAGLYSFDWLDKDGQLTPNVEQATLAAKILPQQVAEELKRQYPKTCLLALGEQEHKLSGHHWYLQGFLLRHWQDTAGTKDLGMNLALLQNLAMAKPLSYFRSQLSTIKADF